MRMLTWVLIVGFLVIASVETAAEQSRCTTTRDPLTGATATRRSDGSRSTTTRDPLTGNTETTIYPPPPKPYQAPQARPQRCTTTRDPLTGNLETVCR